jgi:hypothetical protein
MARLLDPPAAAAAAAAAAAVTEAVAATGLIACGHLGVADRGCIVVLRRHPLESTEGPTLQRPV